MVSQFNPASPYMQPYGAPAMSYGTNANLTLNSLYHTQMFATGYGQITGDTNSLTLGPSMNGPIFAGGQQVSGYSLPPQTMSGGMLGGPMANMGNYFGSLPTAQMGAMAPAGYPSSGALSGIPNATNYGTMPNGQSTAYQPYGQPAGQSAMGQGGFYGMGNQLATGGQPPIYSNEQPQPYENLPRGIAQTFNHIGFDSYGRMIGNLYDMASNGLNAFSYRNRVVGPVDPSSLTSYGYISNPGMVGYVSGVGPSSYAKVTKNGTQAYGGAQAWLFNPVSGTLQDYSGPPRN